MSKNIKKETRKTNILSNVYVFAALFISLLVFVFLDVSHTMDISLNLSLNMYNNHTKYVQDILGKEDLLKEYNDLKFTNDFSINFDHRTFIKYEEFKKNYLKSIKEDEEKKELYEKYGEPYIKLVYKYLNYDFKQNLIFLLKLVIVFLIFIIFGLISYKYFSIKGSFVAFIISLAIYYLIYTNLFYYLPLCGIIFTLIYSLLDYFKVLKSNN